MSLIRVCKANAVFVQAMAGKQWECAVLCKGQRAATARKVVYLRAGVIPFLGLQPLLMLLPKAGHMCSLGGPMPSLGQLLLEELLHPLLGTSGVPVLALQVHLHHEQA